MTSKQTVQSIYPQAFVERLGINMARYWMIYNSIPEKPAELIGYSLVSEDDAWEMASNIIGNRMLRKLSE